MKARIYYNKRGLIVSIVEEKEVADAPRVSVQGDPELESTVVELSGDLSKLSFLELHSKFIINPEDKKLKLVRNT